MASLYKNSIKKDKPITSTRDLSNRQEKSVAKAVGGRKSANSGATMFQKSDVSTDKWNIECKSCMKDKDSFSIKKEWLEKNKREALFMGKDYTALAFQFGPSQENYYIIDELTFQEFLEYQRGEK